MEWEPDGFSLNGKQPGMQLPSLLNSSEIDEELAARKKDDKEIKAGADMVNPMTVLGDHFPHILVRIKEFWGHEKDFDDYMDNLVMKDRSSRTGFPRAVIDALIETWNDHKGLFIRDHEGQCAWENDHSLHKAFKKLEQEKDFPQRARLSGAEAALLDQELTEKAAKAALAAEDPVQFLKDVATPPAEGEGR